MTSGVIAPHLHEGHLYIHISLEKKVLFSLWVLAKQESFLATNDRFGFAKGTGHYIFIKIVSAIAQLKHYIRWPNPPGCIAIASRIKNRSRKY